MIKFMLKRSERIIRSHNSYSILNLIHARRIIFETIFISPTVQRHSKSYRTQQGWVDSTTAHFSGNAVVLVPDNRLTNWMVIIVFQRPVLSIQVLQLWLFSKKLHSFIFSLIDTTCFKHSVAL